MVLNGPWGIQIFNPLKCGYTKRGAIGPNHLWQYGSIMFKVEHKYRPISKGMGHTAFKLHLYAPHMNYKIL